MITDLKIKDKKSVLIRMIRAIRVQFKKGGNRE